MARPRGAALVTVACRYGPENPRERRTAARGTGRRPGERVVSPRPCCGPGRGVLVLASGIGPAVGMVALVLGDLADGSAVVAVLATNGVLILGDLGHGLAVRVGRRVGGRGGLGRRLGIGVGRRVGAALSLRRIAILVGLARDVGDVTAV